MPLGWWVENSTTPTGADLTITGGQPTVTATQNKVITPTGRTLTITGGMPTSGPVATPTGRTITITGGIPAVLVNRQIEPAGATLTLTPGTPLAIKNTIITPSGRTLTLTRGTPVVTNKAPAAYGNVGAGAIASGNPTIASYTAPAGADVFAAVNTDRAGATVTTITYGGVAMELIATAVHNNTTANGNLYIYRLAGAGTGTAKTLSTTTSGLAWFYLNTISITNVGTVGTYTSTFGNGTVASHTITVPSNGLVLQVVSSGAGGSSVYDFTSFSGVTNRFHGASSATSLALNTATASGATTSTAAAAQAWAVISIPIS
ncbi:minor tail protein [Mycobacterium phage MooMoo]|uniref:Minor tail protein n=1 Tax=Mycobacterium phage MooMoo TaxID=2108127 RepID=A0A2P1JR50_9CAUD|nr:minor tail protein [Mycobacterium phage MooMoo]AVO21626.1 minor tail protein [Mycobacterium phage MooMoo]